MSLARSIVHSNGVDNVRRMELLKIHDCVVEDAAHICYCCGCNSMRGICDDGDFMCVDCFEVVENDYKGITYTNQSEILVRIIWNKFDTPLDLGTHEGCKVSGVINGLRLF